MITPGHFRTTLLALLILGVLVGRCHSDRVVAAYLPEYRWYVDLESALGCCVTDVILFSASLRADGRLDDHWISAANYQRARRAADAVPGRAVNVLLCVGGAGRSAGFAKATASKQSRARLVKALTLLVEEHELDGVDFDCEAPMSSAQMANYVALLAATRRAFTARGKLVTVALHPGQALAGSLPNGKPAHTAVDRVHLMTYDMRGAGGHHSTLADTQAAVGHQLSAGVPPEKLVLGLPAYARHVRNPGQVKSYAEVVDAAEAASGAHTPLVAAPGERTLDGFAGSGPSLVADKVAWAATEGMAGVFLWEIGQDKLGHPHSLVAAAAAASGIEAAVPKASLRGIFEQTEL